MILKIKAFIYRFCNIFGLHIYLAKKEEKLYLETLEFSDYLDKVFLLDFGKLRMGLLLYGHINYHCTKLL